ncbi:dicarboxylate/amino acid:cation symporter [Draconibacterium halophilum]|uniref:dicarboxylate/amino acid:cation symporter n=1 Tax=Draconibacterium halophilum TaxID=2706887 RepID=UPI00193FB7CF|nr:dicarboxylate/amino acid:cation symporter [Draconibacterium halophilum]
MKIRNIPLYLQIVIALFLGIIWALLSSYLGWSNFTNNWIAPFGDIFIALLKLIAIPLILFSIIGGIVGLGNPKDLGKMGLKTLSFYIGTTFMAVALGLLLVNTISPGKKLSEEVRVESRIAYEIWAEDNNIESIANPALNNNKLYKEALKNRDNIASSSEVNPEDIVQPPQKEKGPLQALVDIIPENIFNALSGNGSMLQIIFFAIFFGIALLYIKPKKADPIIQLVNGMSDAFIKMIDIIMIASPYFVFALMAGVVNDIAGDDIRKVLELFMGLTWYSVIVFGGLLIMAFVLYPLLLKAFGVNIKYRDFFRGISPAQVLAFSSSSSAATLPVTMECVEENLKIDKKTVSFVLPIGATINMDGTSLYQAVAVIFLAQMHMIDLSLGQQLTVVLTATLASIGSAAIPSAGLVMLMVVLQSVGLNPAWIAIILPVDRILDMMRTVVNVTGDATVCTLVDKTSTGINKK